MRVVQVFSLVLLVGLVADSALADKGVAPEKPWHYGPMQFRAVIPEQEPNDACPGQSMSCGDLIAPASYYAPSDEDWYWCYLSAGDMVTIGTDSYNGSNVDTYLELYDYDCLTRLSYDDDGGPNFFSLISNFTIPHDGYYSIKTFSYAHLYAGDYQLFVTCGACCPPPNPNDICNADYAIEDNSSGVLNGDMTYDHDDYDPGSGGCATGYPEAGLDVAYKMDLQAGDVVDLRYHTPNWDAAFYIITDCSNPAGTCVIGADAAYDTEEIHWTVSLTGTYWLILDHYGTNTGAGPWTLDYSIPCCGPPGACCDPATGNCTMTTQDLCLPPNTWIEGTSCDPNPCPLPNPARETTWGRIKARYR